MACKINSKTFSQDEEYIKKEEQHHNTSTFAVVNDSTIFTLTSSSLEAKLENKQFSLLLELVTDT